MTQYDLLGASKFKQSPRAACGSRFGHIIISMRYGSALAPYYRQRDIWKPPGFIFWLPAARDAQAWPVNYPLLRTFFILREACSAPPRLDSGLCWNDGRKISHQFYEYANRYTPHVTPAKARSSHCHSSMSQLVTDLQGHSGGWDRLVQLLPPEAALCRASL